MARRGENIYERKDGRFEGRYTKGYTINGKPIIGYVYGKTYKEAKEKLAYCKVNVKNMAKRNSFNMSVNDWFDDWLNTQVRLKKSSYTIYLSIINKHIKGTLGKIKLKALNTEMLQNFVDGLSETLSPKTVRSICSVLRLGLKEAYNKNMIADIYSQITLPKMKKKEVKVFNKAEQKQIERYIDSSENPNDIGILLCFYTGIRIGELCALTWDKIDLKRGILSITQTLYRVKDNTSDRKTVISISTPKSESSVRDIPLPKFLIAKLKAIEKRSGFFISKNGKYIEPNVYTRRYKKILKELDIPYLKFHCIRHTFATRAMEIGMDVKTLSEILGHSSPTITLNVYTHSLPEHKRKEMNRLGKLYEG